MVPPDFVVQAGTDEHRLRRTPEAGAPDGTTQRGGPVSESKRTTINDLIARYPETVAVFNRLGIDACCGGDATVEEAARRDGVDVVTLLAELERVAVVR